MKLSNQTLNILKNFASIQPNLVVQAGSTLKTIAENKSVMGKATVAETFEKPFYIYDLNEFLNVYNLLSDPEIEFNGDHLTISSGSSSIRYRYASPEVLTTINKNVTLDSGDVEISITEDVIAQISRAGSALGHALVGIIGDGKTISIRVFDPKDKDSNYLNIDLGVVTDKTFSLNIYITQLKILPGDYDVVLSSKLISKWNNKNDSVEYFIALDTSSSYNK